MAEGQASAEFLLPLFMDLAISLIESAYHAPYVIKEVAIDELQNMKCIDHRYRMGEILVDICQIGTIHIRDDVFHAGPFFKGHLCKIRFGDLFPSAGDHIDRFPGLKVLYYQCVFVSLGNIEMDLIDADDLCELTSWHIDISGKSRDGMRIGDRVPPGYLPGA